ncbi:MAG: putative TIM-barrel fold metal-dependent hydrolase [Bacteriovoracaceae bacterium]|jgi:predicted TIM-barrel fold metal-dependent hydrolase
MNTILLIISFMAFSTILSANDNRIPLDAHLHYWPEHDEFLGIQPYTCEPTFEIRNGVRYQVSSCDMEGDDTWTTNYLDLLKDNNVKTAFLISPSFTMRNRDIDLSGEDFSDTWSFQEKYIPVMDKQVSDISQKYPGRFIGFCGLNYTWTPSSAEKRVKECLDLPGMKGIKMHSFSTTKELPLRVEKVEKVIDATLNKVKAKKPIILWHIKPTLENNKEIDILFQMALKYPDSKFIIAHSMYRASSIEYLLSLEKRYGKRLENLFLETSAAEPKKLKDSWVNFGLDRVLYGSDNFNSNDISYRQFQNSGLTEGEIYQIENIASKRVLEGINIDDSERELMKESLINSGRALSIKVKVLKE